MVSYEQRLELVRLGIGMRGICGGDVFKCGVCGLCSSELVDW